MLEMQWIFDSSDFVTRAQCGPGWSPALKVLYIIPNVIIALCYWWIPVCGLYYWRKRREGIERQSGVLMLFVLFIFFCGVTHFLDVTVFGWAPYRFYTLVLDITAVISVAAALKVRPFMLELLRLPSRQQIHDLNDHLQAEMIQKELAALVLQKKNETLAVQVQHLEQMLRTQIWLFDKDKTLRELTEIVAALKHDPLGSQ